MGAVIELDEREVPMELGRLDRRIRAALRRGARAAAQRGRAHLVSKTPTDQGQLKAAWRVRAESPTFDSDNNVLATIVNDAPHIAIIELGARPHTMSPEGWQAIYDWVRRHFRGGSLGGSGRMRPQPRGGGGKFIGSSGPYHGPDPVIAQITNAIVQKIAKYGQKPTLFVKNSLPALEAIMREEIDRAVSAVRGGQGGGDE